MALNSIKSKWNVNKKVVGHILELHVYVKLDIQVIITIWNASLTVG